MVVGLAVNTLTIITRRIENSNTHQAEFHVLIVLPHLIGGGKIRLIIEPYEVDMTFMGSYRAIILL